MQAILKAIEYYLPPQVLDNPQLCEVAPNWSPAKITSKTGIEERRITEKNELSSDLAVTAAQKLFESGACLVSSLRPANYVERSSTFVIVAEMYLKYVCREWRKATRGPRSCATGIREATGDHRNGLVERHRLVVAIGWAAHFVLRRAA